MDLFIKPVMALWRARGYLLFAGILWGIQTVYQPPFRNIPVADRYWYHDLIDKALGSLDRVAYVVLLAGLIYAVMADLSDFLWTGKIQNDMRAGFKSVADTIATGISGMTHESVLAWVTRGLGTSPEYRTIGVAALREHYGGDNHDRINYLDYVVNNILDGAMRSESTTRENLVENVVLRKVPGESLLRWEDDRRFTVVCPAGRGDYLLRSFIQSRADAASVENIV